MRDGWLLPGGRASGLGSPARLLVRLRDPTPMVRVDDPLSAPTVSLSPDVEPTLELLRVCSVEPLERCDLPGLGDSGSFSALSLPASWSARVTDVDEENAREGVTERVPWDVGGPLSDGAPSSDPPPTARQPSTC